MAAEGGGATTDWLVAVRTGDLSGAGTDAVPFVRLHGADGDSAALPLADNVNRHAVRCARAQSDVFVFAGQRAVGPLNALSLWHDGSAAARGWYVDAVQVFDKAARRVYHFPCGRWVASRNDDCHPCRRLDCSRSRQVDEPPIRLNDDDTASDDSASSPLRPAIVPQQQVLVAGKKDKKSKKPAKQGSSMGQQRPGQGQGGFGGYPGYGAQQQGYMANGGR